MADQFRTTISAVVWTADTDSAQIFVDAVNAQLPEEDQPNTLTTIEFIAAGRPQPLADQP